MFLTIFVHAGFKTCYLSAHGSKIMFEARNEFPIVENIYFDDTNFTYNFSERVIPQHVHAPNNF